MKVKMGKFPKYKGQRINVEIESHDTWNMCHTLAYIIYPMLVKLKEEKHGVPNDFSEVGGESFSNQKSFEFYEESAGWAFEERCKAWDDALDKMIWAFYQLIDDSWEDQYHHGKPEYDWVKSDTLFSNPLTGKQEPTYQMVDKNPGEHWFDGEGYMEHQNRIQEGIELFGKYYQNLWD